MLEYAILDESVVFTGKLHLYRGEERVGAVPHLAIVQDLHTSDLMLFHCDERWEVVGAQGWNAPGVIKPTSVLEVKNHAERYYTGLARKWRTHPSSHEGALAYYEANYPTDRCSFCDRSMHDMRCLVSSDTSKARICDACIERFHAVIGQSSQDQE